MSDLYDALVGDFEPEDIGLSDDDVREIRKLYATGNIRQVDLAEQYGVCQPEISRIVNRKRRGTVQ